jgi:hypothetical protein
MRNGQKRMRGRNRKSQNPLTRVYESNGPDVKIRGTASHVADKYLQLARDAQASGDPVGAENYYQHAEHYFRLIAAAQEQFRQSNPYYRPENEARDDSYDDAEDETAEPATGGDQPFGTREPQPFIPRDAQPFPREQPPFGGREAPGFGGRPQVQQPGQDGQGSDAERLPSFITGGGGSQPSAPYQQGHGPNGHDGQGDRFPLHRRRRRHRGPRSDQSSSHGTAGDDDGTPPGRPRGD